MNIFFKKQNGSRKADLFQKKSQIKKKDVGLGLVRSSPFLLSAFDAEAHGNAALLRSQPAAVVSASPVQPSSVDEHAKPHKVWTNMRYLQQNDWSRQARAASPERELVRRHHIHGVEGIAFEIAV
jgi:hypothetical protein